MIAGAAQQYWGDVTEALDRDKRKVRRVYLPRARTTGVAKSTSPWATRSRVQGPEQGSLVPGLGHDPSRPQ